MDSHHFNDRASQLADQAGTLARHSADLVRNSSRQLRDSAGRIADRGSNYIRDEPIKAVLIAAATGATLMALVNLLTRPDRS